jgi:hypothetical protein
MFAISACTCIPEDLRPTKFYPNASFDQTGGSSIIGPMGDYIADPVYDVETIVYGNIDLGDIALSKSIHNLTGIYSRCDLFSLAIRQKPYHPIVPLEYSETRGSQRESDRTERLEERIIALEKQIEAVRDELNRSK